MAKGGGGGQSGRVDYPAYLETIHNEYLDNTGVDTPTSSITDLVNSAVGSSPFSGETAYDPETPLAAMDTELASFGAVVNSISPETNWDSHARVAKQLIDELDHSGELSAAYEELVNTVRDQLDLIVLPRFRGGMRDINAVNSSAFAIGEAFIEASAFRDINKFWADLKIKLKAQRDSLVVKAASDMVMYAINKGELKKALMHYTADTKRIAIVANKEQTDSDLAIAESDAKWDLDMTMYGGNMIASIAGAATVKEGIAGPSMLRSALGGALSGAGAGFAMGGPAGAAIGGIGGLITSLF